MTEMSSERTMDSGRVIEILIIAMFADPGVPLIGKSFWFLNRGTQIALMIPDQGQGFLTCGSVYHSGAWAHPSRTGIVLQPRTGFKYQGFGRCRNFVTSRFARAPRPMGAGARLSVWRFAHPTPGQLYYLTIKKSNKCQNAGLFRPCISYPHTTLTTFSKTYPLRS